MGTLPFSRLEKTVSRRPKGYTKQPKTIGEHLIKKRCDLKLTKVEMAKRMGIAPTVLADWEKSRCKPDAGHMKNVIEFIGYDLMDYAN